VNFLFAFSHILKTAVTNGVALVVPASAPLDLQHLPRHVFPKARARMVSFFSEQRGAPLSPTMRVLTRLLDDRRRKMPKRFFRVGHVIGSA
jgi:hypothetical protein